MNSKEKRRSRIISIKPVPFLKIKIKG